MFYNILKKEFKLIFRDIHALLVLFVMPLAFILIMSLALKDTYLLLASPKLSVALISTQNKDTKNLQASLSSSNYFRVEFVDIKSDNVLIYEDGFDFVLKIDGDFKSKINSNDKDFRIDISTKADTKSEFFYILKSEVVKAISKDITKEFFIDQKIDAKNLDNLDNLIVDRAIFKSQKDAIKPNSTQQSVPAWLVFSMFFILIPISNTFINEKNFGTLSRIKSINVPLYMILLGKVLPYFVINQLQLFFMLLVGRFIVPLFNADALSLDVDIFLLVLVSFSISFGAIGFALLVANISKTTEEATSIGGVINIIFAALAGVMVPKFIMPEFMQRVGDFSPMSWSLEAFLEILVRGGGFDDIKNYMLYLIAFGTICLIFANFLLNKRES